MENLKLLKSMYLNVYQKKQPITILKHLKKIKLISLSSTNFDFYLSNSAVYSSMIEGNIIDFDSYLKFTFSGMNTSGKSFQEIEDLKLAYEFSKNKKLTLSNFLNSHKILTETIISEKKYRGKLRDKDVYVINRGKIIYAGAEPEIIKDEMNQLFKDISVIIKKDLSINEIFYYASMIHLVIAQIHPFVDGNGRASRLIEKWFLAEKIGKIAWFIQSEMLYQKRRTSYYKNIHLGKNYNNINYDYSIPFLIMLPMALKVKQR